MKLWLAAAAAAVLLAATTRAESSAEAEVRRLEDQRVQAMIRRDAAALERILADDLTYTHSSGRVQTKAEFIKQYTAGESRYLQFDRENVQVRVYGDAAVVTGTAKMTIRLGAQDNRFEIRFIDVYARRSGRWQMVAWQSTRLQQ